ncbi:hypothetical protein NKH30_30760 [Mesorhizobium sp. M1273]
MHVTEANLNYHGSILLDPDHAKNPGSCQWIRGDMEQDFRRANLDLCHPRRARLSMLHPQRRGRPEPASPLHPSGRSAHSCLKPRIVTFVINNVVGFSPMAMR